MHVTKKGETFIKIKHYKNIFIFKCFKQYLIKGLHKWILDNIYIMLQINSI